MSGELFGYLRVSTSAQAEHGVGLMAQHSAALKEGVRLGGDWSTSYFGEAHHHGMFVEDGVSAFNTRFTDRPAAKAMLAEMKPGDTMIITRVDRACRSTEDFCSLMRLFRKRKLNLVCINPRINLGTANGRMVARFWASLAEWESDIKSERIKEALAAKKARGDTKSGSARVSETADGSEYTAPVRGPSAVSSVPPGRLFVLIRCSHRTSVESGLGLKAQMDVCCAYADQYVAENPAVEFVDIVTDPATSCWSIPLKERPYGGALDRQLQRGDHVVVLRPDRIFGSMKDMVATVLDWRERGITAHFALDAIDLGTPEGELILSIMTAFSQMERQLASYRNKEMLAILQSEGKWTGRTGFPPFWRLYRYSSGSKKHKKLIMDYTQLTSYRLARWLIAGMHGQKPMTQKQALTRVEQLLALRENRTPIHLLGVKRLGIYNDLPRTLVPYKDGCVYPLWTVNRYAHSRPLWEKALADWHAKPLREKVRLKKMANRYSRHPWRTKASRKHGQEPKMYCKLYTKSGEQRIMVNQEVEATA